MRKFPYILVDVFTQTALQGNQLAVFTDARGLADHEMQQLAKETNLSETTFILPRDPATDAARGHRVRIFTVGEELPFAGHPTLGTAFVLRGMAAAPPSQVTLDLNVGPIPVRYEDSGDTLLGEMTQVNPTFGQMHDREALARAVGLGAGDLDPNLPIQTVSTGMPFAIVPLRSLAVAQSLSFGWGPVAAYLEKTDAKFLYFVARETVDPKCSLHARMIFYNGEDPATGSAAGCCAGWAVRHGVAQPEQIVWVEQGVEMQRTSHIRLRAGMQDNQVVNVRVGGSVVEVARGAFTLP
jgi:trans-2,3-dihydro-3-hydroxyanthranilate isomerase